MVKLLPAHLRLRSGFRDDDGLSQFRLQIHFVVPVTEKFPLDGRSNFPAISSLLVSLLRQSFLSEVLILVLVPLPTEVVLIGLKRKMKKVRLQNFICPVHNTHIERSLAERSQAHRLLPTNQQNKTQYETKINI